MLKDELLKAHESFFLSIKEAIEGEIMVGSLVYADEENLTKKSDIDLICIVKNENLKDFLSSMYLEGLIKHEEAIEALKNKADYLVAKAIINDKIFSIDIMSPEFFLKICNLDIQSLDKTYQSAKFGNKPQNNNYIIEDFLGKEYEIKKDCTRFKDGYIITLPLFFIIDNHYARGIPTIKMITNRIFYDREGIIKDGIDALYKNIAKRLIKEYPTTNKDEYGRLFLNLLSGRNKFPKEYKESILNRITRDIRMINDEEKVKQVRDEVYDLFKSNAKNDYQKADWIFPNHFDIMIDLCRDMCKKYGGNIIVCELATYLHDVGLVYGRTSNSIEGHESRSAVYAKEVLKRRGLSQEIINEVIECILITDKKELDRPKSLNADIVRTADILSQFISVHYFAKASFFNNWEFFYKWLKDRVESCYKKIYFDDEKKVAKPIRDFLLRSIEIYDKNKDKYPSIFSEKKDNKS